MKLHELDWTHHSGCWKFAHIPLSKDEVLHLAIGVDQFAGRHAAWIDGSSNKHGRNLTDSFGYGVDLLDLQAILIHYTEQSDTEVTLLG
jgi:hypothetical protein